MKISASFLTSRDKATDLKKLNLTDVDYIHVDYMDGKFVKNKSLPFRQLKKVYKYTCKRLDVHLMAEKPEKLIRKFASLNTEFITVHVEINRNIEKILYMIHAYGIKAGLSIKPNTDINKLLPYLDNIDLILVMGVEPGRGGQPFIKETKEKLESIRNMLKENNKENVLISVDGGITGETKQYVDSADILVCGNYITSSNNFQEKITSLR